MIPNEFTEYFRSLNTICRQQIVDELLTMMSPNIDNITLLESAKSKSSVSCPKCGCNDVRANGKYKDVQRYNCKECKKYFRDTTGKPVFGLKKAELFPTYLHHMLTGLSIEKCAKQTGICIQTSFDWRHKILSSFQDACPEGFQGIVESDDIFFLESGKGNRELNREPRKRGGKATKRGISDEQIAVVVTCDRSQNKELKVATKGRVSKQDLEKVFESKLENIEVLCTDTHRSYTAYAKSKGISHQKFNVSKGQRVKDKVYHVQNVNNTASRLRTWMRPFSGVATKYLQNYLNWFMILERIKNNSQRLQAFASYAFAGQTAWQLWKSNSNSVVF